MFVSVNEETFSGLTDDGLAAVQVHDLERINAAAQRLNAEAAAVLEYQAAVDGETEVLSR